MKIDEYNSTPGRQYGMPLPRGVMKAKSAVSSILYSTMTLTFDLLTQKYDTFISVP